jgi:hypothetical protein
MERMKNFRKNFMDQKIMSYDVIHEEEFCQDKTEGAA